MNNVIVISIALGFNVFDLITGLIKALKSHEKILSSKLRDGLFKKVGFILCYVLAWFVEYASAYIDLPINVPLVLPIVVYTVVTETVSIIENIAKINPDITPDILKRILGLEDKEKK